MSKVDKARIETIVNEILKKDNFFENSFYSIKDLMKKEEINYFKVNEEEWEKNKLPKEAEAIILISSSIGKNILMKEGLEENDERFSIAHEIGHLYIHAEKDKPYFACMKHDCEGEEKEKEDEADYFAACLLMPEKDFKEMYKKVRGLSSSNESLATLYGVNKKAIEKRILELGLDN
ncbi:MAG: ImmA/IrrE family metallo-endopeptidase [Cetobacterium sp.]